MQRQHFDCTAKKQAKFISFCKHLELLDPLKDKTQKGGVVTISSTTSTKQILKKKRGRDDASTSLTASQTKKERHQV
eukprot:6622949-Ditylum_brightwellii.AAC.2